MTIVTSCGHSVPDALQISKPARPPRPIPAVLIAILCRANRFYHSALSVVALAPVLTCQFFKKIFWEGWTHCRFTFG